MAEIVEVPVTLIVEGVLQGSDGALLYRRPMLERTARRWEGMPVTYGHPSKDGRAVSAKARPDLKVGAVREPRVVGNRLRATAVLNLDWLRPLDPAMADAIAAGKQVEVSTGLVVGKVPARGTYGSRPYEAEVTDGEPDHLALMPAGKVGACSVRDGCGIHNEETAMATTEKRMAIRTAPDRMVLVNTPEALDELMEKLREQTGTLVTNAEEVCGCGRVAQAQAEEMADLIARLVMNLDGQAQEDAVRHYATFPIGRLRGMVADLVENEVAPEPPTVNYFGAQGGPVGGYHMTRNEVVPEMPDLRVAFAQRSAGEMARNERVRSLAGIGEEAATKPQFAPAFETGVQTAQAEMWEMLDGPTL